MIATIACKEFDDAVRSRMLWAIVVIIAVMTSLAAGVSVLVPDVESDPAMALGGASQFAGLLVPILALIGAALAIAGQRETGSLKVLLGLPPSRGQVLLGTFLGRSGVVAIGIALGFAVSGVVTAALHGGLPIGAFLGTVALTVVLGVAFVGIAIGVSAVARTRSRAMTLAVAAYLGLTLLWDLVPVVVHLAVRGTMPGQVVPPWLLLVEGLSPTGAYTALTQTLLLGGEVAVEARIDVAVPAYLHPGVFVAILVCWTILPLAIGAHQFERADLS